MISEQYIWLTWSLSLLIPWLIIYLLYPLYRKAMLWASLFTTPFGLTEPIFVPEYWSPPSLFDLAITTGFDIESLIFCFAIGGVGSVFYNAIIGHKPEDISEAEKVEPIHRHHYKALSAPFIAFPLLYFFPWNPIYPSILAMLVGVIANVLCRPDLLKKSWVGGLLFLVLYSISLIGLEWGAPGYIERVWNIASLSGIHIAFIPLEELLFAIAFGMYWSGVYEHFTWKK